MSFLDLAQGRYATKKYNPERKISSKAIEELMQILRLSPSSINSQPWNFFFVSHAETKSELAVASYMNKAKVNDASHVIVFSVLDNVSSFEEEMLAALPESSQSYYNEFLKPKGEFALKSWLEHQVYLSLGFFLAACASMEIDSTAMEGIDSEEYSRILKLSRYRPLFAVAIGYRDDNDKNQPSLREKTRLPVGNIICQL